MSRLSEKPWAATALNALAALFFSGGLSITALSALLPGQALLPALGWCALFSWGFYLLFSIRLRFKWLIPLICLAGLGLWGAAGGGPLFILFQLAKAGFLAFRGIPEAIAPYADTARLSVCLIFSMLAALAVWDRALPFSIILALCVTFLSYILGGSEQAVLYSLPAAAAILMMAVKDEKKKLAALPVALLLVSAAFLLTPSQPQTSPEMEKTAQDVRNLVEDYLLYDDYRTSFSLHQTGYQPMESRLGGPAEPKDYPVMEVYTDLKVLLRGKSYDTYTGLNWLDTLSYRRYLYISPRFESLRDDILDLQRPLSGAGNLQPQMLRVHLLNPGSTTLFTPQRIRNVQLESDRMVLYYNAASELFITRDVNAGDSYTITYLPLIPENKETLAMIGASNGLQDEYYSQICQLYLPLPGHIQQEIKDLAEQITYGLESPYEKALAIETYLRTHFIYDLNVPQPPDEVDFVAWFLIGQKKGYCTYFASAMTVLCRLSGVPARYVTGYLAVPDENGLAYVTGEHAHAWTEVYLNGFGWLSFDATPRRDNDRDSDGEAPPQQPENDAGRQPTPTPSPAPSPAPTATPDPEQQEEEKPDESEAPQDAVPSPSPSAAPTQPSAVPSPAPHEESEAGNDPARWPWLLLAAALLTGLAFWRFLITEPVRRAHRHPGKAVHIYYDGILGLLAGRGIRKLPQETLHQFAEKGENIVPGFAALMDAYAAQVYGPYLAEAEPFEEMYLLLRSQAGIFTRLSLAVKRMGGRNIRTR